MIYTAQIDEIDGDRQEIRLKGTEYVTAMIVDRPSRNLYYYDYISETINVLTLNGKYRKTIVDLGRIVFGEMTLDLHNQLKITLARNFVI